jgi:hypothetical protein
MVAISDVLEFLSSTEDTEGLRKIRSEANKALKKYTTSKGVSYHFSAWAMGAAQGLWMVVKDRYPFMPDPNLGQWAEDIDKLHRIDKYEPELVQAVIKWSQQDPFWRQQVRSGANLRKHFNQMLVRIKEEKTKKVAATF